MKFGLLFVIMLSFLDLFAFDYHYYYQSGKRIEVEKIEGSYTFRQIRKLRSVRAATVVGNAFYRRGGTYLLRDLGVDDEKLLDRSGIVLNGVRRIGGTSELFPSGMIYIKSPNISGENELDEWLSEKGFFLERKLPYLPDWILVSTFGDPIDDARELVEEGEVLEAEPSFFIPLRRRQYIPDDPFFYLQWYLNNSGSESFSGNDHTHVAEAWSVLINRGIAPGKDIWIAIIDDGFDLNHEDLQDKFIFPKDFGATADRQMYNSGRDKDGWPLNGHGTSTAGVAGANFDNGVGMAGACPGCKIIPIRFNDGPVGLDDIALQSFEYAFAKGADIVSNSWGPPDRGGVVNMSGPLQELVAKMAKEGRNGKGTIILFAAGNGNESMEEDGFASNPNVIAVGATNASGRRAVYSDFGRTLDIMASSGDWDSYYSPSEQLDPIVTTDISGDEGFNTGSNPYLGDESGNYFFRFDGTSSSCPLAAGIVALVLSANPDLTFPEVYSIIGGTADKIGGSEAAYINGFSLLYGYGRINAAKAVEKALSVGDGSDTIILLEPSAVDLPGDVTPKKNESGGCSLTLL